MTLEVSNGTTVPHATDSFDLFEKLRTFLTVTLPVGERWTELHHHNEYAQKTGVFASIGSVSEASNPFNDPPATWSATGVGPWQVAVGYDRAVHVSSVNIVATGASTRPADFTVEYSDDNVIWFVQDTLGTFTDNDWLATSSIKQIALTGTAGNKHLFWRLNISAVTNPASAPSVNSIRFEQDTISLSVQMRKRLSLRGQGSGSDQIFINLDTDYRPAGDWFNWRIFAATGFLAADTEDYLGMPGANPKLVGISLRDSSIPYWFMANGRRFIMIAKVDTTFHALHGGFILPYATPAQFPYPVMIGGSNAYETFAGDTANDLSMRWSSDDDTLRNFYDPGGNTAGVSNTSPASCWLRFVDGTWHSFKNRYTSTVTDANSSSGRNIWPGSPHAGAKLITDNMVTAIDGSYVLFPFIIHVHGDNPSPNIIGEIQGVEFVTGFSAASEDTITVGGDTYLMIPNVFRTDKGRWAAFKLE